MIDDAFTKENNKNIYFKFDTETETEITYYYEGLKSDEYLPALKLHYLFMHLI